MNRVRLPLPQWTHIAGRTAIVAPLAALLPAALPWVPMWEGPMNVVTLCISAVGLMAALAYAFACIRSASSPSRRSKVVVVLAVFVTLLSGGQACLDRYQFFPVEYAYSIDTRGARAYVFNGGLLEREVTVRVQLGPFPIHAPLLHAPRCHDLDVELDTDGYTLLVCGERCDVRTRRCAGRNP